MSLKITEGGKYIIAIRTRSRESERFVRRRSVKEVFLKILQNRQTPVPESLF